MTHQPNKHFNSYKEGMEIPLLSRRLKGLKSIENYFPIIEGAGVTLNTIKETFRIAGGVIIGIWFNEEHVDSGHVMLMKNI